MPRHRLTVAGLIFVRYGQLPVQKRGDACKNGDLEELLDFFDWFSKTPATHRIFVAGNHDLSFVLSPDLALNLVPKNVVYLENRRETIEGIVFLSLPARPWLHAMPEKDFGEIDVLLTHGPAHSGQEMTQDALC